MDENLISRKETPTPYVFSNREELFAAMGSDENRTSIRSFFGSTSDDISCLVKLSVSGNTFRAFHLAKHGLKPSVVYRSWVSKRMKQLVEPIQKMKCHAEMRALTIETAHDLSKHWNSETRGRSNLDFGRAAKMLNLSFKHLLVFNDFPMGDRQRLIDYLDVPLDSFTLQGVRLLLPDLGIPANATMKAVGDEQRYIAIQDAIRNLCGPSYSPVHYEFASWNKVHPNITALDISRVKRRCSPH